MIYNLACMDCFEVHNVFLFPIIVNVNIMIAKAVVKAMHINMSTAADVFPAEPESKHCQVICKHSINA